MSKKIYYKSYIKSLDLCGEVYPDSEVLKFFEKIHRYFCWGKYQKVINYKKITLQSGEITMTERELSQIFNISRYYISAYLSLLCTAGILCRSILARNIIIYSLSEEFFKNSNNPFEQAKKYNLNKSILKGEARSRWIKGIKYTIDEIEAKTQKRNKEQWDCIQLKIAQEKKIAEHKILRTMKQNVVDSDALIYFDSSAFDETYGANENVETLTLNESFTQVRQHAEIKSNSINSANFENEKNIVKSNSKNDQNEIFYTGHYNEYYINIKNTRDKETLECSSTTIHTANNDFAEKKIMKPYEDLKEEWEEKQEEKNQKIYEWEKPKEEKKNSFLTGGIDPTFGAKDDKPKQPHQIKKTNYSKITAPPEKHYCFLQKPVRTPKEQLEYEKENHIIGNLSLQILERATKLFGEKAQGHIAYLKFRIGTDEAYRLFFKVKENPSAQEMIEILKTNDFALRDELHKKLADILMKKSA